MFCTSAKNSWVSFSRAWIITAEGEELADFLVETLFRGQDVADAGQEFIEIVQATGVLEALVVHDEAFDEVFLEMTAGPLAELDAPGRADAVADGQNEVEVVELDCALDLTFPLGLNCQGFLDSCLGAHFPILEDVFGMKADVLLGRLEKLSNFDLGKPDRPAFDA